MWKCRLVKFCLVSVSLLLITAACSLSPEKRLVDKHCSKCHSASVVYSKNYSVNQWENTVRAMKVRGMQTTAEEDAKILDYLTKNYGEKR